MNADWVFHEGVDGKRWYGWVMGDCIGNVEFVPDERGDWFARTSWNTMRAPTLDKAKEMIEEAWAREVTRRGLDADEIAERSCDPAEMRGDR